MFQNKWFGTFKTLRQNSDSTPTIFLTSYKDKDTPKRSLLKGCDDYIKTS